MNPITIPNIAIPVIGLPTIGIPPVGFPSASGGGLVWPKDLKESIKAIYDPAKQGMTNYDVIESYAEDFTNWIFRNNVADATIANNKLIITETKAQNDRFIYSTNANEDLILYITGIDTVGVCYYNGSSTLALNNGLNKIHTNKGYIDIRSCRGIGACNITITQLPTSILKDLSGNGNHAYLYGGKGKLNSGMGVYQTDFSSWNYYPSLSTVEYPPKGLVIKKVNSTAQFCASDFVGKFTAEVSGIPEGVKFYYRYIDKTTGNAVSITLSNGINEVDCSNANGDANMTNMFLIGANNKDINITITQIPDYPNQLCYDGKMYAVCYGFPILEDYTVMADRTWFDNEGNRVFITKGNIWPNCAFNFEKVNASLSSETFSYSQSTNIDDLIGKSGITYQTKQSYNGKVIGVGTSSDGDILLIGGQLKGEYIGCHGKIIIADRSFTKDEITWLKDNFFTIDIPTPAYDFDFSKLKSGENTFTDKYGNELSLHNFAWNGMSGLGGYGIDVSESLIQSNRFDYTYNDVSKEFVFLKALSSGTYLFNIRTNVVQTNQKIKITNIGRPIHFVNSATNETYYSITQDGIYDIDFVTDADTLIRTSYTANQELNLKVQFLPTYPNALVFDGVDDYCKLSKMTIKTVILDFVNLELNGQIYDNRDKPNNHYDFSIYPEADTIAYEARNSDGKTYIDGELNTTIKTNDLLEVRCIVCASNNSAKETEQYISKDSLLNNFYGKMALYRITGFTEVLTPDQIWKWYQKNQPKGGDK